MAAEEQFRIGVDTGGTITDVIAVRQSDGTLFSSKVPSTPSDPSQALLSGVRRILGEAGEGGASESRVSAVIHGTTVATNVLLEREDHNMGLLVTEGFRFILEIARQSVPEG